MKQPRAKKQAGAGMDFMTLLKAFEGERGWVKFQIDSFNHFIDYGLQEIIN
jgi:hypothetical protein